MSRGARARHPWPRPALFAAVVLLSLVQPAPAAAGGVGAVADVTWGQPTSAVDREIELLRAAGVEWIRANVNWAALESSRKGEINAGQLAQYDYAIDQARRAGLRVLMPIADGVPFWASADPDKHIDSSGAKRWNRLYPPADMSDYGDVVRFVVEHFRAKGVHAYELWNEPNHPWFWASGPDPAAYVGMLQSGYRAAKAADPGSTVLLGGLSKNDFEYLEGVYRAGGGGYFDAVAVHPYTYGMDPTVSWNGVNLGEDPQRISKNAFPAIQEIKRTMDAHGDSHKMVWITEFGFSTTTQAGGVSEARQAEYLTKAFSYLERFPWIHSAFWYAARNNPFAGDRDDYEDRFGLFTTTWDLKPSYEALRQYAAAPAGNPGGDSPPDGAAPGMGEGGPVPSAPGPSSPSSPSSPAAPPETPSGRPSAPSARIAIRFRSSVRGQVFLSAPFAQRIAEAARRGDRAVTLYRRTRKGWRVAARVKTDVKGRFSFRVRRRARTPLRLLAVARYGPRGDRITVGSRVLVLPPR